MGISVVKISLFSFSLLFHSAVAFNITQVLSQYASFSTFNSFLTLTNLASEINSRQSITVLVVENNNLSPLSGKSSDVLKKIMSVHVILDYFDVPKLQKLSNKSTIVTTLFQTTGLAKGQQGFVNVTQLSSDSIAFGSAVPGSTISSNLVKSVVSQPYNFSVLQVTNVIIPEGIDGASNSNSSTSPSPSSSPRASTAPSMAPGASPNLSPTISQSTAPATSISPSSSNAPSQAPTLAATPGSAPIPSAAPTANAPVTDAPSAGVPSANVPAPDTPVASTPVTNGPAADTQPADNSQSADKALHSGLASVLTIALSSLCLASRI
ncbi:fasciclin-like arabinogalactan protein 14 [Sesamum indicum]|uniref:Fasciclin-like arabinogalactan protein 14 n=1 Tax=Sesamum indicum TaxID=4182 RepID=A0A6I9TI91_SESIN|nr:fasciclin-like arabinogalactan protein 14 [Sesamum indicum]